VTTQNSAELLELHPLVAEAAIFHGETFPRIDFVNREWVKAAVGGYTLSIRYFDAAWNEVQRAVAAGRYGAWVDVHLVSGLSFSRQVTLFQTSAPYHPVWEPYAVQVEFPAVFGLSKEVVAQERWNTNALVNRMMGDGLSAVLAATLHDIEKDPARWRGFNYWYIEESWWTTLRQKLNRSPDYRCLINLPEDYAAEPDRRWPLLVFLHGTHECGDDLDKLRSQGPLGWINRGHSLPFVVLSPLCPKGCSWNPGKLMRLIQEIEQSHRIDPDRIYVTGLSMGGFSAFDLAACYPERIAAIAPLSAGENPEIAERMARVPAWIFHGADDRVVSCQQSIEIAERLKKMGAEPRLSVLPGVGHEGWDTIYSDPELYAWLLGQARKQSPDRAAGSERRS